MWCRSDLKFRSLFALIGLGGTVALAQTPDAASPDFFESKVRPVLATNCYSCHSSSAMGGLRVDSAEGLQKGGKRGPAIVSGDPEKSLLIQLLRHSDAKQRMPMGGKLKDSEVEALSAWVKAGAAWPAATNSATNGAKTVGGYIIHPEQRKFWSFQPLSKPAPPTVRDSRWARTDIDRFILAKLEKEGIAPVAPASRRDLLRRASLDLTGLPPTTEQVRAFEQDKSADAFARVVDRLLASPQYGERWGRMWLDVARYGEDDYRSLDPMRRGFNPYPNAYMYRDWVIQAINDDLPFDQFVKAQLAGDQLDLKSRHKTLPATGFLGLGPWYYDNGSAEVTRADERHDRVDVVTRGFLGLTVGCARCHDHKYDPVPQTDYYAIAGVFYNTQYEEYPMAPKSVVAKYTLVEEQVDIKQKMLTEMQNNFAAQLSQSLAYQASNYLEAVWEVTGPPKKQMAEVVEKRKLDFELLDRWIRYMAKTTEKYKYKEAWQAMMKRPTSKPQDAKKLADKFQQDIVSVMLARNEINEENKVIADKALEGTKRKKRTNKPSNFITNEDFCPGCSLQLKALPEDQNFFWTEVFLRELNDNDDPNAMMAMGMRNIKPGLLLFRGWGLESRLGASAQTQLTAVRSDIEAERKKLAPYFPFVHGVKDLPAHKDLPLHIRGNPEALGDPVPRQFLSVLSDGEPRRFSAGSGRLELAEAIVKQPLAIRVYVNRIWRGHFGTGIVDTPSNFGTTGERPTNPELLEYLASKFVADGYSTKKLHREIMLSSVYQLSTASNAAAMTKDADNRLYWRANPKRLDAEQLRDSILLVSGNLDKGLGGPSEDLTPAFNRRTVYGKVSRYKLDQYLQLFDFPNPSISAERRFTTTVPLQRLFLMNSDFMQIQAEEFVKRIAAEPDNRSRIRKAYQMAYGREPSESEVRLGIEYLKAEPLRAYEEAKKRAEEEAAKKRKAEPGKVVSDGGTGSPSPVQASLAGKPEGPAVADGKTEAPGQPKTEATEEPTPADSDMPVMTDGEMPKPPEMGMGMMGGVMPGAMGMGMGAPRGPGPPARPEVKYEPTAWGRYIKVLLSSSEFLYIN
ncbi:MAG TPA: PSD1 and planctomycete cytochrome C domain-containing protein [Bryobacteraceae bacterium]|nr:PSD1 and planctomycete cytochrome C domain-containing protein [Bryobacteraceae bacterium]